MKQGVTQADQNLAEWEAIRADQFPEVTDQIQLLHLHRAYMLGYGRGMAWMRNLYNKELSK